MNKPSTSKVTDSMALLDVVALTVDLPDEQLRRGQVGTVVEVIDDAYLVEFSNRKGETFAMLPLHPEQLMRLYFESDLPGTW